MKQAAAVEPAANETLAEALLALAGSLAPGAPWPGDRLAAAGWDRLAPLAERHGLLTALYPPDEADAERLPAALRQAVGEVSRAQFVRNYRALVQLDELAAAFAEAGLRLAVLKGGAALLELYERLEQRQIADLDLLVPEAEVEAASELLRTLGYQVLLGSRSPEERLVRRRRRHLDPFRRPGELLVEVHVNLADGAGRRERIAAAVWERAALSPRGVRRPDWTHFMLHTATHYLRERSLRFGALKGLVDLLLVARRHGDEIDWERFWREAEEWGALPGVGRLMSSLNEHWQAGVPGVPEGARPFSPRELAHAAPNPGLGVLRLSWSRLAGMAELRGLPARTRYLAQLVAPSPASLRARYRLPPERSVAPYYFRYAGQMLRRLRKSLAAAVRPRPPDGRR